MEYYLKQTDHTILSWSGLQVDSGQRKKMDKKMLCESSLVFIYHPTYLLSFLSIPKNTNNYFQNFIIHFNKMQNNQIYFIQVYLSSVFPLAHFLYIYIYT